jgi:hypothetical protein
MINSPLVILAGDLNSDPHDVLAGEGCAGHRVSVRARVTVRVRVRVRVRAAVGTGSHNPSPCPAGSENVWMMPDVDHACE